MASSRNLVAIGFLAALVAPAVRADDAALSAAKKAQAEGKARKSEFTSASELRRAKTRQLGSVLDQVVAGLEKEGIAFDRVQGDFEWNPLPEVLKRKVALERHHNPPRLMLQPAGGERVYAWVTRKKDGWTTTLECRGSKKDFDSGDKLEPLEPKFREALLSFISGK